MKPKRVYIDTSVVGGCLEPEFRGSSLRLFGAFRSGEMIAVVSDLTEAEVERAPQIVRAILDGIPAAHREGVRITRETRELAERYMAAGVVSWSMWADARHVAAATIHEVDVLASWNFKHIVNTRRIHGYNTVNLSEARPLPNIQTPAEVIGYVG
jgi:hypothetical protein